MIRIFEHTNTDGDTVTVTDYGHTAVDLHLTIDRTSAAISADAVSELRSALRPYDLNAHYKPAEAAEESALDPQRLEALLVAAGVAKGLRSDGGPFGTGTAPHETVLAYAFYLLGQINVPAVSG